MRKEYVVLVDKKDAEIGKMEKMEAHVTGTLHRAFSVFIFNSKGEMMIHRRALSKYHSPGLWTNACCSHPRQGEITIDAAHRRMVEEMGFDCDIKEVFSFLYKSDVGQGLTEHEFDHVFVGTYDGDADINEEEVDSYKLVDIPALEKEILEFPERFTVWFKIAFKELISRMNKGEVKL